jgi:hypothetical protein
MYEVLHLDDFRFRRTTRWRNFVQRLRSRRARYARRRDPKQPIIRVPIAAPVAFAGSAERSFRWYCEGCGANGEVVIRSFLALNFLAAAQTDRRVSGARAGLLPASDVAAIVTAHRRYSPQCFSEQVIDLLSAPARQSGGTV